MNLQIDLNTNLDECGNVIDGNVVNENTVDDKDGKNLEPYTGLEFDTQDDAYSFYLRYAKCTGFGISKKSSRRSKLSGEFIDAKFACTRYGIKRESTAINQRPCLKVDCKALLHVKRNSCGKWYVQNFIKEHNHELYPSHAHYFPCHRSIAFSNTHSINMLHAVGVGTNKIFAAIARKNGGYENIGYTEKDIRNHLDKERRLALELGDARAMLNHFMQMQEENPNFFYAVDLDEEQRLKNVFWVDATSREDYKIFGDVVSFDTTYITNKYKMLFAPFIGVNNHFQSILLGCALLADETTSTFVWLMQTWLRAMGGKHPIAILTYQDKAMKATISIVFPNSRHRFCMWHILRKIPEKLSYVIKKDESFMRIFNDCVYNSWLEEDFEKKWWNMIGEFELEGNEWLGSLYEDRKFWVPTYMRDTFFAGLSTTQRSESINSFFDKYVSKKTSLKEFVEQYKVPLQDRQEKEAYASFSTLHKKPVLKSPSPFEKQMSRIYTHEVFKKFQVEVLGASACFSEQKLEVGTIKTFEVKDFEKNVAFMVNWEVRSQEINCLCRLFEYNGFLCRHVLCVLQSLGVFSIPPHYILKRWSKNAKSLDSTSSTSNIPKGIQFKKQRFDKLFYQATKLSEEGSLSSESFNIAYCALQDALEKCIRVNRSLKEHEVELDGAYKVDKENIDGNLLDDISILDPQISSTKGAPKRMKKGIEKCKKRILNTNSRKVS
ncbi:protein FAR-RED IMPAIRED RESPONSE 1 [Citrus sinensis]|nr:protein FAR-RED IMPAIRED RESPONSE 1 [Citrus sinensis]